INRGEIAAVSAPARGKSVCVNGCQIRLRPTGTTINASPAATAVATRPGRGARTSIQDARRAGTRRRSAASSNRKTQSSIVSRLKKTIVAGEQDQELEQEHGPGRDGARTPRQPNEENEAELD